MPELWNETGQAHRGAARDTPPGATVLAAGRGLTAVTVPRIAERTGNGRATPRTDVPDAEQVPAAGREHPVAAHPPRRTAAGPRAAVHRPVRAPRTRRRGGTGPHNPRAPRRTPAGR
ncbi:hypothetical protein [Streptomyces sp. NPDC020983]|uniref:hypothetical protein n=1 Tax=Streptomyces sp. NPDC020983 TaxID=3365106 RepID=UPI00379A3984